MSKKPQSSKLLIQSLRTKLTEAENKNRMLTAELSATCLDLMRCKQALVKATNDVNRLRSSMTAQEVVSRTGLQM